MNVLGLILAIAGAVVFVWSSTVMVLANRSYHGPSENQHRNEKAAHLIGALLLAVGFGLQLTASLVR
jgi:hypothetical protein